MQKKAAEIKSSVTLMGFSFWKIDRLVLVIKKGLVIYQALFYYSRGSDLT